MIYPREEEPLLLREGKGQPPLTLYYIFLRFILE